MKRKQNECVLSKHEHTHIIIIIIFFFFNQDIFGIELGKPYNENNIRGPGVKSSNIENFSCAHPLSLYLLVHQPIIIIKVEHLPEYRQKFHRLFLLSFCTASHNGVQWYNFGFSSSLTVFS